MPTRSKLANQLGTSNLEKVVSNVSGWTQEVHLTKQIFIVEASYVVALSIAKAKKPHTIAETLVKPCLLVCAKISLVIDGKAYNKFKQVFFLMTQSRTESSKYLAILKFSSFQQ